jgi:esterase/lipase
MRLFVISLILFNFSIGRSAFNDSDCVKTTQITTAESSWPSRAICTESDYEKCLQPTNENADLPLEFTHGKKTSAAIVLFHGLSDSPYFLKDIGFSLFKSGMNVMIPRLTGHGTCAEHLNNKYVTLQDWIGGGKSRGDLPWAFEKVKTLGDVIYVGGFSLGGALATYSVLNKTENFAGLFLFSPALWLHKSILNKTRFGNFISNGAYHLYGGAKNYGIGVRYQKISAEGTYEVWQLSKKLQELRKNKVPPELPIFVAITEYDNAIDVDYSLDFIQNYLRGSKAYVLYGNAEHQSKRSLSDLKFIVSDEIKHSSIMLNNAEWSSPEENPHFAEFIQFFESYLTSRIPSNAPPEKMAPSKKK